MPDKGVKIIQISLKNFNFGKNEQFSNSAPPMVW